MNIYDKKPISCVKCKKCIGEIDYDAKIINQLCGQCVNSFLEGDTNRYTINYFQTQFKKNPIILEVQ